MNEVQQQHKDVEAASSNRERIEKPGSPFSPLIEDHGQPSSSQAEAAAAAAENGHQPRSNRLQHDQHGMGRMAGHAARTGFRILQKYAWYTSESCVFLAALFFALSSLCVKLLKRHQEMPAFEIVCFSGALSMVLWWAIFALAMGKAKLYTASCHLPYLLGRGFFGFAATGLFYLALEYLDLASAVPLHYLNPAITSVIAWLLLGERLGPRGVAGVVLSIIGIFLKSRPPFLFPKEHEEDKGGWDARRTAGTVMALASALTGSFSLLSVRYIKEKEPALAITVWYHLFCLSFSAALLVIGIPSKPVMPQGVSWILLIVVGILLFSASLLIDRSLQLGAAARTSVISLSQLVFTWLFGLTFLHEHTDFIEGSGIALLLIGVGLVAFRNVVIEEELNTPALKRQLLSRLPDPAAD